MIVNIRRRTEEGWFSNSYILEAQIEPTEEELALIHQHSLAGTVIFDSEFTEEYAEGAAESASGVMDVKKHTEEPFFDYIIHAAAIPLHLAAAAYKAVQWTFSLRVTVQSLLDGMHVESDDATQINAAEAHIAKGAEALKSHLQYLTTFDDKDESYEI